MYSNIQLLSAGCLAHAPISAANTQRQRGPALRSPLFCTLDAVTRCAPRVIALVPVLSETIKKSINADNVPKGLVLVIRGVWPFSVMPCARVPGIHLWRVCTQHSRHQTGDAIQGHKRGMPWAATAPCPLDARFKDCLLLLVIAFLR